MTAKEFRNEQDYPYNHFTKLTSTGISADYDHIEAFAEAYHQSKVKNLGLFSVIERAFWQGRKCVKHQDFEDWFTDDIKKEIESMFL